MEDANPLERELTTLGGFHTLLECPGADRKSLHHLQQLATSVGTVLQILCVAPQVL